MRRGDQGTGGADVTAGPTEQAILLARGAAEVSPRDGLAERLAAAAAEGRPLRVKLGIDPSSAHLTIGHAVVLRKLAQFQRLGHPVVLIIGNFPGMVGDPSGRSQTRRQQTEEEFAAHARTYLDQVAKVLDVDAAEVRWNAEWLAPMTFADVAGLAAHLTVANLLERDDFRIRHSAGQPISLVEFLYPLMQGMDSVAIRADVELGGTDQTFNLHVGRELQRAHGQPGQVVLTMPLLRGIDGVQKMSKSLDNGVYLDDPPEVQFGKLMRIPDHLVPEYLRLCTDLDPAEADRLAVPEAAVRDGRVWVVALLAEAGLVGSRGEARRLVAQGAVRLDGQPVDSVEQTWAPSELDGRLLTVGRRPPVRLQAEQT